MHWVETELHSEKQEYSETATSKLSNCEPNKTERKWNGRSDRWFCKENVRDAEEKMIIIIKWSESKRKSSQIHRISRPNCYASEYFGKYILAVHFVPANEREKCKRPMNNIAAFIFVFLFSNRYKFFSMRCKHLLWFFHVNSWIVSAVDMTGHIQWSN